jgi:hypothetical protein
MSPSALLHLEYKVANAQVSGFPFPHFYLRDVFPAPYYDELQGHLPDPAALRPLEEARGVQGYKERFVLPLADAQLAPLPEAQGSFWKSLRNALLGGSFGSLLFEKFRSLIEQRFQGNLNREFYDEALLVQDVTRYQLGPHTDSTRKVVTVLFYLPKDDSQLHLGTSIYVPKDRTFTCPGGPHHPRDKFDRMYSMPFAPNSMFVFLKSSNSFHGVEQVADPDCRRWLLLYDIYVREA